MKTSSTHLWWRLTLKFACTIAIVLFCCFAFAGGNSRMEQVASRLSCFCGTCPHLVVTDCGCSVADKIKADISTRLSQGETEDQIIQSYVAKYGQTALAAPPKSGFNLTAWLIPFLAFGIGGTVLVGFLIKQRKLPKTAREEPVNTADEEDSHYRKLLESELQKRR